MTRWAPEKHDTVGSLADEILHNYARGRAFVAVDGPDRSAAATFADDLAAALVETGHAAFRASLDDFVAAETRTADTGPADKNAVDETTLRAVLIEPFRSGGSTSWAPAPSAEAPRVSGPADAVLVVDAALADRQGLAGLWNYAVWVVGSEVADRRSEPRNRATAVIDNTDPEHPRRLFDDAC